MTKPVTIPNTFATATTAIPLSNLDADFSTVATAMNDANTYSNYAPDTGSANAYVVTLTGVSTTYSAGLRIQFKAGNANTTASTLNVNAQGAKNITYQDASALASGTIAANSIVDVMYDGTQFLLMNDPAGGTGGDVVGPASATDNAIVRFDGTTGKLVQNSVVTIADSTGDISGVGQLNATTVDATNIEVTNIKAKDGTAAATIADSTGVVTVTAAPVMTALTASQAVFTTAGKALTSNAITGTGNVVMSASPTLTGTIAGASLQLSSLTSGRVTYAGASGLLQDSANLLYSGTDLTVYGITVGRGAGAVSTNTAVGASALAANTTGALSVAVGYYALQANTSGDRNHAIGYASMYTNTTGNYNTVFGYAGLYANTTGSLNTALGYACLVQNTTGASNVAVGHETLQGNTTANANTSVGYQSAYSNTTGSNGAVLGYQALYSNTTGTRNTAIGNAAMYSNTTANDNTGVGANALPANTTGANNVAVGSSALQSNTTASGNTAIGYQAGYSNTTGANNQVFGYQALYSNQTGSNNAAFGTGALSANTASDNSAFGSGVTAVAGGALVSNTSGTRNAAFGNGAAALNTTGNYNTALGVLALYSNTTASNNTAVGYQAGYSNQTGTGNTFIGIQAGYATTGARNTFVGDSAGTSVTTGARNTFIGGSNGASGSSGSLVTTGSANTILGNYNGNQGGLDIRTSDNRIVIADGDGNPRIYVNDGGEVICGGVTDQGAYNLQCNGTGVWGAGAYVNGSDERLKDDIQPLDSCLNVVNALRPVTFKYKPEHSKDQSVQTGFIAQELQQVLADKPYLEGLVQEGPQHLNVAYQNIIPLLTKAIQEQQSLIESLTTRVAQLEGKS